VTYIKQNDTRQLQGSDGVFLVQRTSHFDIVTFVIPKTKMTNSEWIIGTQNGRS
jgi:hypothetical protein